MGRLGRATCTVTLDFCPRPARKETNVPLHKRSQELTVLIYVYRYCDCNYDDNCVSLGLRVAKVIPCAKLQTNGNEQFVFIQIVRKLNSSFLSDLAGFLADSLGWFSWGRLPVTRFTYRRWDKLHFYKKKSNVAKWFFYICNAEMAQWRQKSWNPDIQSQFSMSKKLWIFLKKIFIEEYQFRTTFFFKYIFW